MRKSSNIDYMIGMTRDFVNGKLDALSYKLDYTHEFIERWDKMCRENADLADAVHFYLFDKGFDTVPLNTDDAQLRKVMKRQYKELAACMWEDFGIKCP